MMCRSRSERGREKPWWDTSGRPGAERVESKKINPWAQEEEVEGWVRMFESERMVATSRC